MVVIAIEVAADTFVSLERVSADRLTHLIVGS